MVKTIVKQEKMILITFLVYVFVEQLICMTFGLSTQIAGMLVNLVGGEERGEERREERRGAERRGEERRGEERRGERRGEERREERRGEERRGEERRGEERRGEERREEDRYTITLVNPGTHQHIAKFTEVHGTVLSQGVVL